MFQLPPRKLLRNLKNGSKVGKSQRRKAAEGVKRRRSRLRSPIGTRVTAICFKNMIRRGGLSSLRRMTVK
jgi:hypothetical protein